MTLGEFVSLLQDLKERDLITWEDTFVVNEYEEVFIENENYQITIDHKNNQVKLATKGNTKNPLS